MRENPIVTMTTKKILKPRAVKNKFLQVAIDDEFRELLRNEADKYGMTVSSYIRFIVSLISRTNLIELLNVNQEVKR